MATVPRGELEVIEYVPRQADLDADSADHAHKHEDPWGRLRLENRTLMSCAAGAAALALHVLVVAPVLWTGGPYQHQQRHTYQGNVAALQWVILADFSDHSAIIKPHLRVAPSLVPVALTDPLRILLASVSPAEVSDSSSAQADPQSSLGATYGRYLGQIQARVDRAWQRPRTAIGAPLFRCQVHVDQDAVGRVQEITLLECNGGSSWQLSLVHAIQSASPLPAPSNPAVFARHILLAFRAMAYSPGAPVQLYAPPTAVLASDQRNERADASLNAFRTLREAAQAQKPRVLKLQIEGSKVDVEPDPQ